MILHGIGVISGRGRHEPDSEYASVRGITKSFHLPSLAVVCRLKPPVELAISERIRGVRERHFSRDFHKIVRLDCRSGLGKGNEGRRDSMAGSKKQRRAN